jgi:hypothetical protein
VEISDTEQGPDIVGIVGEDFSSGNNILLIGARVLEVPHGSDNFFRSVGSASVAWG